MEEELKTKTEESIRRILNSGITTGNIDNLYRLVKANHIAKEDMQMNYGNYGEYGRGRYGEYGRGNYGEYGEGSYGRRGRRYRGDDELDRMSGEYGRYQENRGRYGGSNEETDKSFHYMVKAFEDFIMVLKEEADTPQQKQQLMQVLQNSIR